MIGRWIPHNFFIFAEEGAYLLKTLVLCLGKKLVRESPEEDEKSEEDEEYVVL